MATRLHAVRQSVSNDRRRSTGSRRPTSSGTPTVTLQPIEVAALLQSSHPPVTDGGDAEDRTVEMIPLVSSGLADEDEEPTQPGKLARGTTPLPPAAAPPPLPQPLPSQARPTTKIGRRARETRRSREMLRVDDITPTRRKP